ncbi:MAG TPA: TetR/AcrR family transcriptional regulator [Paraburkholderia sp.]
MPWLPLEKGRPYQSRNGDGDSRAAPSPLTLVRTRLNCKDALVRAARLVAEWSIGPDLTAMKRKHLTHEQRRHQTQERLLRAAHKMFIKKGFSCTSVEDIADAAGYTRGAFYSNFRGKSELLLEVLRRDHERARAGLQAIMEKAGTREEMTASAIAYYSGFLRDRECFPLWVEARLLARRDAVLRQCINDFRRERLSYVGAHILVFFERVGIAPPLQAEVLALGLLSLCDGMQSFRVCDPLIADNEVIEKWLAFFFGAGGRLLAQWSLDG